MVPYIAHGGWQEVQHRVSTRMGPDAWGPRPRPAHIFTACSWHAHNTARLRVGSLTEEELVGYHLD